MKRLALFISLFAVISNSYANFRLASYNIRNFDYDVRSNTPTNKTHLIQIINEMEADLVAVQEINEKREFERMVSQSFFGKYNTVLTECGGAHGQKLGFIYNTNKLKLISFKQDLRTVIPGQEQQTQQQLCHTGSRPLGVAVFKRIDTNEKIVAITVHLKAGGRANSIKKRFKQLKVVNKVVSEFQKAGLNNIIIMGDFNSTEYIFREENYNKFSQSVSKMNMVDTTQEMKCSAYWWGGAQDSKQYPSALDHILLSKSLSAKMTTGVETFGHCKKLKCEITLENQMGVSFDEVSDHCPILTEVK